MTALQHVCIFPGFLEVKSSMQIGQLFMASSVLTSMYSCEGFGITRVSIFLLFAMYFQSRQVS